MDIIYKKNLAMSEEENDKYYRSFDVCRRRRELTSRLYPEFSIGFLKSGGGISSAPSVEKLFTSSAAFKYLFGYRYYESSVEKKMLFAVDSSGYIYMSDLSSTFSKTPVVVSGNISAVPYTDLSGNDYMLFIGKNAAYKYNAATSEFTVMSDVPECVCAELHGERLFTLDEDGYTVRFSKALDIEDWEEAAQGAGYVSLPSKKGNIVAMKSFGGYLYLFRERGITRLRAMGDNMNFQHVELDVHCGNIYPESLAATGEYIAFASDGGIFLFDGTSVKAVSDEVAEEVDLSSVTSAATYRNCAVMCVKTLAVIPQEGKKGVGTATSEAAAYSAYSLAGGLAALVVDGEKEEAYLLPFSGVLCASAGDSFYIYDKKKRIGKAYEAAASESGEYMGGALACVWDSGLTDFSFGGGEKVFRRLYIKAKGDYVVTVYGEKRAVRFSCGGDCVMRPMLSGRLFGVRISSSNAEIYSAEVKISEYRYT